MESGRLFWAVLALPIAFLAWIIWNAVVIQGPKTNAWREWCRAVGGVPLEAHYMRDTCIAKEVVITKDGK